MDEKEKQEIEKLKILNEIYVNENARLKYEYTILKKDYDAKRSLIEKIIRKIYRKVRSVLGKIKRKISKIFKR